MADPEFDAVIVGSGAGGGTSAWALAHRGLSVLLLEAGPAYDPLTDYRLDSDSWERECFPAKIDTNGRQSIAPLETLDPKWDDLRSWNRNLGRFNRGKQRRAWGYRYVVGLGGTTLHFTGEAQRLHPQSMKMRSRFGVAADWPLDYDEIEPYYLQAERLIGVAGPADEPTRPRSAPYPLPEHPLSYAARKIQTACREMGQRWVANAMAALSAPYDGRPGCNYCGNCNRGCPRLDKGSVDVTFIAKARETERCAIKTDCQVIRLAAGPDDRVTGVHYIDAMGAERVVTGRAVVVACGAVETPRLLLVSENQFAPDGLANESGLVGRNFMETLAWISSGLHPEPLGSHRGLPADAICWDFNAPDAIPGVVGGCRFNHGTTEVGLNGPIAYAQRVVGGWGRQHKAEMRSAFGRVLSIGAIGESPPNEYTYVDLDPEKRDRFGQPLARIHARWAESDLRRLTFMARTAREMLRASGVEDVFEEFGTYDGFDATHVFGTCRMGDDPGDSVVDRFCRSHRWRNLFVVDGSVFPSSGGGEAPSLTIEALAIRTAAHRGSRMRDGGYPVLGGSSFVGDSSSLPSSSLCSRSDSWRVAATSSLRRRPRARFRAAFLTARSRARRLRYWLMLITSPMSIHPGGQRNHPWFGKTNQR